MDSVNYTPPARRSMSDEQLAMVLSQPHTGEASMIAAMQLLEQQSALRAEDIRLENLWVVEMQMINSAESIAALNAFRGQPQVQAEPQQPVQNFDAQQQPAPNFSAQPQPAQQKAPAPSLFDQIAAAQQPRLRDALEASSAANSPAQVVAPSQVIAPAGVVAPAQPVAAVESEAVGLFPLVPVAPAPDISVAAAQVAPAPAFEPVPAVPVAEAALGLEPESTPNSFETNSVSVEQQVTEFEELLASSEESVTGSNSNHNADALSAPVAANHAAHESIFGLEIESPYARPSFDFETESEPQYSFDNADEAKRSIEFDEILETEPLAASDYVDEAKVSISTAHGPKTNQRASALFFNWLPIGGSVLPVVLAVYVHSLGLALTDAVTAVLVAIFAAFVTTTAGAIAGKRAGLPTFVVSRATFGVFGARFPAAFFAILKLATASVMVLLLVIASHGAVNDWSVEGPTATRWDVGPLSVALWQIIIGAAVLLVAITSFVRLRYIKFLNLFVGIIASAGVIGALGFELYRHGFNVTFYYLESWPQTLGAAAIVFAALGTVWSSSGADFASSLRQSTKGASVVGWSSISLFILPGAIATSTLVLLEGKKPSPHLLGFSTIVPTMAQPYAYGVFAAVALLLAAIELRSTRLAVRGLYTRWSGALTQTVLALTFVAISLAGWHFYSSQGLLYNLKDYALILSVPVAAWLGIFSVDSVIRRIAYHEISLTRSYGFYGNYNLTNLFGWMLASVLGLGMISSSLTEFAWVGFLSKYSVNPEFWSTSNLGIALAFALGAIFPLCFGIPRIKRQEAEVLSIESRRYELRDVLVTSEIEQIQPAVLRGESNI